MEPPLDLPLSLSPSRSRWELGMELHLDSGWGTTAVSACMLEPTVIPATVPVSVEGMACASRYGPCRDT